MLSALLPSTTASIHVDFRISAVGDAAAEVDNTDRT
jgi:hypothetical protein